MTGRDWDKVRTQDKTREHDRLQTGHEYFKQHKPLTDKQRKFIATLRIEVGDASTALPTTCFEGRALIDELLSRKKKAA